MNQKYPAIFNLALTDGRRAELFSEEADDGSLKLSVKPMCLPHETKAPKMLLSYAAGDYCELTDTLAVTTSPGSRIVPSGKSVVFNRFYYDIQTNRTSFVYDGQETGWIETDAYLFTVPQSDQTRPDAEYVTFASVAFYPQGKSYDYLCEIPDVSVGDHVIIYGYNGETEAEVTDVFRQDKNELAIPLERYKKILRKV